MCLVGWLVGGGWGFFLGGDVVVWLEEVEDKSGRAVGLLFCGKPPMMN